MSHNFTLHYYLFLLIAIAVAIFDITTTNGMRYSDIENVLGQLSKKRFSLERKPVDQSIDSDKNIGIDEQELLQNIARSPQLQLDYPYKEKELMLNEKHRMNKHGRYTYWPWRQIIYVKPAWLKSVNTPRKQNYPFNDIEKEEANDLGDFSKVYLVLNPDADITNSDVRDLSKVVSSALAKHSTPKKSSIKDRIQKKRRYKGFLVKDSRKRMRDSKEKYVERDSIERDYKPKRSRAEYGGGGGRTAIPYIGHRGDIFERE